MKIRKRFDDTADRDSGVKNTGARYVPRDDDLLRRAGELTGVRDQATLLRLALETLIARESARRLANLGGTQPHLAATPRRRSNP